MEKLFKCRKLQIKLFIQQLFSDGHNIYGQGSHQTQPHCEDLHEFSMTLHVTFKSATILAFVLESQKDFRTKLL